MLAQKRRKRKFFIAVALKTFAYKILQIVSASQTYLIKG